MPDGYIYAYRTTTQEVFTDVLADVGYQEGMRVNSSGAFVAWTSTPSDISGYIPVKPNDIIRLENCTAPREYGSQGNYSNGFCCYDENKTYLARWGLYYSAAGDLDDFNVITDESGTNVVQFTLASSIVGTNVAYLVLNIADINADSKVYVNSTIEEVSEWTNTGLPFVSTDYSEEIADHEARLKLLEANTDGGGVPDYWITELETKADTIQQTIETAGRNKSAFFWYTDAHWQTNSKMSPILLKYLCDNTPINKVNFGGDIINDPSEFTHANIKYAYQWRKMIADLPNHHSVYGNHDVNHRVTDVANIAYSIILADEESAEMIVGGDSYYYIDSPSEKTRYLYLSYMTSDVEEMLAQGNFIVEAIKGVDEGWHIVVIAHRWFQYNSSSTPTVGSVPSFEQDILNVFDEYNARATHSASNYFYAQDFTDCKGKVEFCIGGHIHVDYDFTTTGGIPVIITASDTNQERSGDETEDCGTVGTITESAVYGIVADYTNNKITVVGVGRGGSRVIGGTEEPDEPVPETRLFNLDRTYVSGTEGEKIGDHLDENKAYINVPYTGDSAFYANSCTATGISENSVTVTESGVGGICVAYPIHLTDIETQSYKIAFDYSGAGKCRTYFKYATANGELSSINNLLVNDTAGASDSAEITIPAVSGYGYEWVIIYFSSNTGNTKTFTNVSLTKAN